MRPLSVGLRLVPHLSLAFFVPSLASALHPSAKSSSSGRAHARASCMPPRRRPLKRSAHQEKESTIGATAPIRPRLVRPPCARIQRPCPAPPVSRDCRKHPPSATSPAAMQEERRAHHAHPQQPYHALPTGHITRGGRCPAFGGSRAAAGRQLNVIEAASRRRQQQSTRQRPWHSNHQSAPRPTRSGQKTSAKWPGMA